MDASFSLSSIVAFSNSQSQRLFASMVDGHLAFSADTSSRLHLSVDCPSTISWAFLFFFSKWKVTWPLVRATISVALSSSGSSLPQRFFSMDFGITSYSILGLLSLPPSRMKPPRNFSSSVFYQ